MAKSRLKAVFHGRVQGVGFRFMTRHIAKSYPVTGRVRNCPDGTVELFAEGEKKDVDGFLESIGRQMSRYIEKTEISWGQPEGNWVDFRVSS